MTRFIPIAVLLSGCEGVQSRTGYGAGVARGNVDNMI